MSIKTLGLTILLVDNKSMKDQLLYFWVHKTEYSCFDDNEFNFSCKYQFHFDYKNRILTQKTVDSLNIFEKESCLSNIDAVVGNNGTGKTTLLKLLLNCNPRSAARLKNNSTYSENCETAMIIAFSQRGSIKIINLTWNAITYINELNQKIIVNQANNADDFDFTRVYISSDSKTNKSLFFSSKNRSFTRTSNYKIALTPWQFKTYKNQFVDLKAKEAPGLRPFERFDFEKFVLAHFLSINGKNITGNNTGILYLGTNVFSYGRFGKKQKEIYNHVFRGIDQSSVKAKYSPMDILFLNLECEALFLEDDDTFFPGFLHNEFSEGSLDLLKNYFAELSIKNTDYYLNAIEELQLLKSAIIDTEQIVEMSQLHSRYLVCDLLKLKRLFDHIVDNNSSFIFKYLDIELEGSDGEMAHIKHLSYLYFLKNIKRYLPNSKFILTKNMIIELDEIDVHLHPELQRQLIDTIIEYLNNEYGEFNIHFIITTHSPIVLSDIPNQNVIYIKKGDDFKRIVERRTNRTFGANIYSLYNDSFFFSNNSLIGEYAKKYINNLYMDIKNGKYSGQTKSEIDLIGEPVIRSELKRVANIPDDKVIQKETRNKATLSDDIQKIRLFLNELEKKIQND